MGQSKIPIFNSDHGLVCNVNVEHNSDHTSQQIRIYNGVQYARYRNPILIVLCTQALVNKIYIANNDTYNNNGWKVNNIDGTTTSLTVTVNGNDLIIGDSTSFNWGAGFAIGIRN